MSIANDIAQELIDTILDFLHDDIPALLASSLVSRKWVPAPRHHIFGRRIVIHHFLPGRRGNRGFMDNATPFLEICRSPLCSLVPSMRNVVLNVNTEHSPAGPVPRMLTDIFDVLAKAPIKKMLFVDHTSSLAAPVFLAQTMGQCLSNVQELSYNALGRIAGDILAIIAAPASLHTLSIYGTHRGSSMDPFALSAAPQPGNRFENLSTLRICLYARQSDALLSWMKADSLRLETLDLTVFHGYHNGWGPVTALNAFLHGESTATLKVLSLSVVYEDDDNDVDEDVRIEAPSDGELDLSALTKLHTLRITSHSVESVCAALASLPPSTLRIFRFDYEHWLYYEDAPCACNGTQMHMFVHAVQTPQLDSLTVFDLRVPDYFDEEGMVWFREQFGKWAEDDRMLLSTTEREWKQDSWEELCEEIFE
ncbi:hypothetical protein FB45DRAFT_906557 [Roridomyces roridus]|uniref:Uncharacterized protein n=1 Tax=Roridomyces roridus TaxID=1738132 RepID=A0AAD7C2W6_9AGAR|nr:hypothetical protein FB45DRAFT_906557 [Roridomyces roridus]